KAIMPKKGSISKPRTKQAIAKLTIPPNIPLLTPTTIKGTGNNSTKILSIGIKNNSIANAMVATPTITLSKAAFKILSITYTPNILNSKDQYVNPSDVAEVLINHHNFALYHYPLLFPIEAGLQLPGQLRHNECPVFSQEDSC